MLDWQKAQRELSDQIGILEATMLLMRLKRIYYMARKLEQQAGGKPDSSRVSLFGVVADSSGIFLDTYDKHARNSSLQISFVRDDLFTPQRLIDFPVLKGFYSPRQELKGREVIVFWKGGIHES